MLAQARHPVSIGPTALVAVPSPMGDA
jgi:hypothetical protein